MEVIVKRTIVLLSILLAACAAQQQVALMPRAPATERGDGVLDRMTHDMQVTLGGQTYVGKAVLNTGTATSTGYLGALRTTSTTDNSGSALLVAPGGQIRCDYRWDAMFTMATGVCIDSGNLTYDVLIRNP